MTIIVETIKRRAGGRVSVRPTSYDKNELTLGRATDCDIQLHDLRIDLHHAKIMLVSADRARVEASGENRLQVNGQATRMRELRVAENNEIKIGPYQITLKPGESHGDLLICIEQIEPASQARDTKDSAKLFSMRGYAPAKRSSAWLLAAMVTLAFLALPIIVFFKPAFFTASAPSAQEQVKQFANNHWLAGGMASAHANLVEDCSTCHAKAFTRVLDETCLDCHQETHEHADPHNLTQSRPVEEAGPGKWAATLRTKLNIPEGRCGSCHFEHNGPEGVISVSQNLCIDCHDGMDERLSQTKLYNVSSFEKDHPEFRASVIQSTENGKPVYARISLSEKPTDKNGLIFPHDFHMKEKEVARKVKTLGPAGKLVFGDTLECVDCHRIDAARALFQPIEMERHCADCHSLAFAKEDDGAVRTLPHGEPEEVQKVLEDFHIAEANKALFGENERRVLDRPLSAEARRQADQRRRIAFSKARQTAQEEITRIFSEDGACQKCHTIEEPAASPGQAPKLTPTVLTNRFLPKGYFPHSAHMTANLKCVDCHDAENSSLASDVLLPSISECRECHNDTHGRAGIASDCLTCHVYHGEDTAPLMTPAKLPERTEGWPTE